MSADSLTGKFPIYRRPYLLPGTLEAIFVPGNPLFRFPGTPAPHFVPGSCFPGAKLPQFAPGNLFFLSPGAKPPLFAPGRRRFRVKPGMTKEGLSGKLFPQGLDNGRRDDDLRLLKGRFEV